MEKICSNLLILMADDDEDDWMFARFAVEEMNSGHDLRFVADGMELLSYLQHTGDYSEAERFPRPDLILLDLNMPHMDGREALEYIKSDPGLKSIPISILTTSREDRDRRWSRNAGAVAFLTKPSNPDEWTEILEKLCISIGERGA